MGWSGFGECGNLTAYEKTNLRKKDKNDGLGEAIIAPGRGTNQNASGDCPGHRQVFDNYRDTSPDLRQRVSTAWGYQAGHRCASGTLHGGAPDRGRGTPAAATVQPDPV